MVKDRESVRHLAAPDGLHHVFVAVDHRQADVFKLVLAAPKSGDGSSHKSVAEVIAGQIQRWHRIIQVPASHTARSPYHPTSRMAPLESRDVNHSPS
ncbi:hypothetical protein [Bradyrhizobium sp. 17]|uniref:hypothetical protein n=1 Tax=Bradyrhizobium sp. 17 TaxID=2782649 RepID=UPI001FF8382B|nr:hypothetical protein [Bradyrhizobium sp. 17]MCK1520422.1 hypothetical protein [Bradyrhizobium sp. 17]